MSDHIWLKNYPAGVPANINPDSYPHLVAMLNEAMKKFKKKPAFECMGTQLTYGQVDKMSRDFGAYLLSRGLVPGDKIALMMPNLLQYPIAIFGALRAGLIVVNTNPLYTPREMKHQFVDSGAKAILIADNFAANLEKVIEDTDIKVVLTTSIGAMHSFVKRKIVDMMVKHVKRMVPKYDLKDVVTFREALMLGKKFSLPEHHGKPDDVILLQYTGGTTGVAKGAMLTNRNLVANMEQIRASIGNHLEDGKEVALSPLPLYHIFAFSVNCLALGGIGALNVLVTNPRDLPSLIKDWKRHPTSIFTGVNTLYNALLNHPDFNSIDFSTLKISVGGGMAVQKAVSKKWEEATGCYLAEGYGLSETSPVLTINPIDGTGQTGTIGFPAPSTQLRIVDEQGNVLGPNQAGEIQAKGPQVMKGYYNKPEETAKVMTADGWFATGDIGLMKEDGFFQIVDRKKDMILVSGFNVYPNEIEDVVVTHEKVLEVAAVGKNDEKSGEVVMLFVVKKDKSLSKDELKSFCRENLTGYKNPKYIEFVDDLPKTNVGKILRRELRDMANKA
ncbi:MAG: AMP-binding protein [Bacteroidota bacterium]